MRKVVCDTNVAISGLLWKGRPYQIMRLAEKGEIQFCGTLKTLEEFQKVLRYPKFRDRLKVLEVTYDEVMDFYEDFLELYEDLELDVPIVVEDPDDDIFIGAALVSGAKCIISGDDHLLNLGEYEGVRIVSVRGFLERGWWLGLGAK